MLLDYIRNPNIIIRWKTRSRRRIIRRNEIFGMNKTRGKNVTVNEFIKERRKYITMR